MEQRANINSKNNSQKTILHFATEEKFEIIPFLLENKSDPNIKDESSNTPFFLYCDYNGDVEYLLPLLKHKADPNIMNNNGITPFIMASRLDNVDITTLLLIYGADINILDNVKLKKFFFNFLNTYKRVNIFKKS